MDKEKIKVAVRVKPQRSRELGTPISWQIRQNSLRQVDPVTKKQVGQEITFDHVFSETATTQEIFEELAKPILDRVLSGINGTIFAYGQTASGKTHTMIGTDSSPGLIKLSIEYLIDKMSSLVEKEFLMRASYVEIFNEQISDLISDKKNLNIREIGTGQPVIDLEDTIVNGVEEIWDLLMAGERRRHYGVTKMNDNSSRSHTILRFVIENRTKVMDSTTFSDSGRLNADSDVETVYFAHLNLVDLAGSEKTGEQLNAGGSSDRFREGCFVNKGLLALGQVIQHLSEGKDGFVNYRDSKLTRILQSSLGGNATTAIICTVTPSAAKETLSTLEFGARAIKISNKPVVNEACDSDQAMLKKSQREIRDLKNQITKLEKTNKDLGEKEQLLKVKEEELKRALELKEEMQRKVRIMKAQLISSKQPAVLKGSSKLHRDRRKTWFGGTLKDGVDEDADSNPGLFVPLLRPTDLGLLEGDSVFGPSSILKKPPPLFRRVPLSDGDGVDDAAIGDFADKDRRRSKVTFNGEDHVVNFSVNSDTSEEVSLKRTSSEDKLDNYFEEVKMTDLISRNEGLAAKIGELEAILEDRERELHELRYYTRMEKTFKDESLEQRAIDETNCSSPTPLQTSTPLAGHSRDQMSTVVLLKERVKQLESEAEEKDKKYLSEDEMIRNKLESARKLRADHEDQIEQQKAAVRKVTESYDTLMKTNGNLMKTNDVLTRKLQEVVEDSNRLTVSTLAELNLKIADCDRLQKQLDDSNEATNKLISTISSQELELKANANSQQQVLELQKELASLFTRSAEFQSQVKELSQVVNINKAVTDDLEMCRRELCSSEAKVLEMQTMSESIHQEHSKILSENLILQDQLNQAQECYTTIVSDKDKYIHSLQTEIEAQHLELNRLRSTDAELESAQVKVESYKEKLAILKEEIQQEQGVTDVTIAELKTGLMAARSRIESDSAKSIIYKNEMEALVSEKDKQMAELEHELKATRAQIKVSSENDDVKSIRQSLITEKDKEIGKLEDQIKCLLEDSKQLLISDKLCVSQRDIIKEMEQTFASLEDQLREKTEQLTAMSCTNNLLQKELDDVGGKFVSQEEVQKLKEGHEIERRQVVKDMETQMQAQLEKFLPKYHKDAADAAREELKAEFEIHMAEKESEHARQLESVEQQKCEIEMNMAELKLETGATIARLEKEAGDAVAANKLIESDLKRKVSELMEQISTANSVFDEMVQKQVVAKEAEIYEKLGDIMTQQFVEERGKLQESNDAELEREKAQLQTEYQSKLVAKMAETKDVENTLSLQIRQLKAEKEELEQYRATLLDDFGKKETEFLDKLQVQKDAENRLSLQIVRLEKNQAKLMGEFDELINNIELSNRKKFEDHFAMVAQEHKMALNDMNSRVVQLEDELVLSKHNSETVQKELRDKMALIQCSDGDSVAGRAELATLREEYDRIIRLYDELEKDCEFYKDAYVKRNARENVEKGVQCGLVSEEPRALREELNRLKLDVKQLQGVIATKERDMVKLDAALKTLRMTSTEQVRGLKDEISTWRNKVASLKQENQRLKENTNPNSDLPAGFALPPKVVTAPEAAADHRQNQLLQEGLASYDQTGIVGSCVVDILRNKLYHMEKASAGFKQSADYHKDLYQALHARYVHWRSRAKDLEGTMEAQATTLPGHTDEAVVSAVPETTAVRTAAAAATADDVLVGDKENEPPVATLLPSVVKTEKPGIFVDVLKPADARPSRPNYALQVVDEVRQTLNGTPKQDRNEKEPWRSNLISPDGPNHCAQQ